MRVMGNPCAPSASRPGAPCVQETQDSQLGPRLQDGLNRLGLALDPDQQEQLIRYLALLSRWNAVYNLTAVREPSDMLALHVLDSLSIADLVRRPGETKVLDVGTGAGLPGVPLAIALPRQFFHLVDAAAKKISFLQQVKVQLALANLHPQQVRVEALTLANKPDFIVSRAYADLPRMLRTIAHLVAPTTTVIAMKGIEPTDELARLPAAWEVVEVHILEVPFVAAQRCAVILRRAR